jgi:L-seryl-tRNA(Ser) seleniumtransferase
MLSLTKDDIAQRAQKIIDEVTRVSSSPSLDLIDGESAIGGGAGPTANLPTRLITVSDSSRSAQEIETILRTSTPPIISRIADQKVLIDLRTVLPHQEAAIVSALSNL